MYISGNNRRIMVDAPYYEMFTTDIHWLICVDTYNNNGSSQHVVSGDSAGASPNRFYTKISSLNRFDVSIPSQARNSGTQSLDGYPQLLSIRQTSDDKFEVRNINLTDITGPLSGAAVPVARTNTTPGLANDNGFGIGGRASAFNALNYIGGIAWAVQLSSNMSLSDMQDIAGGVKCLINDFSSDIMFLADFSKPLGIDPYSGFSLYFEENDSNDDSHPFNSSSILPLSCIPEFASDVLLMLENVPYSFDLSSLFPKPTYTDNASYTFSGTLPSGMSYNSSTKTVEGTPTTARQTTSASITRSGQTVSLTCLVAGRNAKLDGDSVRVLSTSLFGVPMQYNDFLRAYFKMLYHRKGAVADDLMKYLNSIGYRN